MKNLLSVLALLCLLTTTSKSQMWGDYTLYSLANSSNAYLLDTSGNVYHTWSLGSVKTGYSSYLMPGGNLVRAIAHQGNSFSGGGMTGEVQIVDYHR